MDTVRQFTAQGKAPGGAAPWTAPAVFTRWLAAGTVLTVSLIAVMAGRSVYDSNRQHRELAMVRTQNVAQVLERYVAGVIDKTDLALKSVAFEYEGHMFQPGADGKVIEQLLAARLSDVPEADTMRIATANGMIRFGNVDGLAVSIADRE